MNEKNKMKKIYMVLGILLLVISANAACDDTCDSCSDCTTKAHELSVGQTLCLSDNIVFSGGSSCINISNGVRLDGQGYEISSSGSADSIAIRIDCYEATITGCYISKCEIGIYGSDISSATIEDNTIEDCSAAGISVVGNGADNDIRNNTLTDNYIAGIYLDGHITGTRISSNDITGSAAGIWVASAHNNDTMIIWNKLYSNGIGIEVDNAANVRITRNYIKNSVENGIYLDDSRYAELNYNIVCGSYDYDVYNWGTYTKGLDDRCNETYEFHDSGYSGCRYTCTSETFGISGYVYDEKDAPIRDANVYLSDEWGNVLYSAVSSSSGYYSFKNGAKTMSIDHGTNVIFSVSKTGYIQTNIGNARLVYYPLAQYEYDFDVKLGENNVFDFYMEKTSDNLCMDFTYRDMYSNAVLADKNLLLYKNDYSKAITITNNAVAGTPTGGITSNIDNKHGIITIYNLSSGFYYITGSSSGYQSETAPYTLLKSTGCSDYLFYLYNTSDLQDYNITVTVFYNGSEKPSHLVDLYRYNPQEANTKISSKTTSASGVLTFYNIEGGQYYFITAPPQGNYKETYSEFFYLSANQNISLTIPSQTTISLSGTITDCGSGQPVYNAYIAISNKTKYSNINGQYSFSELSEGMYFFNVEYEGYFEFGQYITLTNSTNIYSPCITRNPLITQYYMVNAYVRDSCTHEPLANADVFFQSGGDFYIFPITTYQGTTQKSMIGDIYTATVICTKSKGCIDNYNTVSETAVVGGDTGFTYYLTSKTKFCSENNTLVNDPIELTNLTKEDMLKIIGLPTNEEDTISWLNNNIWFMTVILIVGFFLMVSVNIGRNILK